MNNRGPCVTLALLRFADKSSQFPPGSTRQTRKRKNQKKKKKRKRFKSINLDFHFSLYLFLPLPLLLLLLWKSSRKRIHSLTSASYAKIDVSGAFFTRTKKKQCNNAFRSRITCRQAEKRSHNFQSLELHANLTSNSTRAAKTRRKKST